VLGLKEARAYMWQELNILLKVKTVQVEDWAQAFSQSTIEPS
jgi:hypothetical protein